MAEVAVAMSPNEILCVDDDLDILSTVARLLRAVGHLVTAVDTPASALAILGARPIAVLVSDFEMPEMNGVELAVRAREIQPETVRIMLTGHRTVETAMQGINVGEVFRFLSKPFDPEHLQREVAAGAPRPRGNASRSRASTSPWFAGNAWSRRSRPIIRGSRRSPETTTAPTCSMGRPASGSASR